MEDKKQLRRLRNRAGAAVYNAIGAGILVRASHCSICGKDARRRNWLFFKTGGCHGHHPDYNKPLDVIWLCPMCHKRVHMGLLELNLPSLKMEGAGNKMPMRLSRPLPKDDSKYVHTEKPPQRRGALRKFFSKLWDIIYGGDAS